MVSEHLDPEHNAAGRWNSSDWLIAAILFAATLISRIPFRTTMLYAWDSVLYTRAIELFDVRLHQPQPPGHIFYVGMIRLVNSVISDPNAAMVWISILAASVSVAVMFFLGRTMFGRDVGLVAALLLATSLSFWLQSEVAYPYTLLGCLSVVVAAMIYPTWTGSKAWVLPSALALAIASGFRQDLLPFLLPLLALGIWDKGRWRITGAAAILIAGAAAWYIPSALLSGGFTAYRQASSEQSDYLMTYFAVSGRGLEAFRTNLDELGRFMLYGLSSALLLVPVMLIVAVTSSGRRQFRDQRLLFLLAWIAPSMIFYIFIHVGEYGYIFSFLPALLLLLAWNLKAAAVMFTSRPGRKWNASRALWGAAVPLILINLVLFLALSPPFSANRLAARDDILRSRIETIRNNFDPEKILVISVFDYQQASYYLPEYHHWNFDPSVEKMPSTDIPDGVSEVVIFEEYLAPAEDFPSSMLPLDREQELVIMDRQGAGSVRIDWETRKVYLEDG